MNTASPANLDFTLIAPAHNEQDNVSALVEETFAALSKTGLKFEFIIVDDGSTDQTRAKVVELMASRAWLRCIAMTNTPPGKGNGQSAAFHAGFAASRGRLVATIDADLQNDPGDIPALLERLKATGADMVQGDRSAARKDNVVRRASSRVGRFFRSLILADAVRDTGCSLRILKREIAVQLPLQFKGMHRFIPVTAARLGYRVVEMPVRHRPRVAGVGKYGMGIMQRAIPGLIDCFAVRWMTDRRRPTTFMEAQGAGVNAVEVSVTGSARGVAQTAGSAT